VVFAVAFKNVKSSSSLLRDSTFLLHCSEEVYYRSESIWTFFCVDPVLRCDTVIFYVFCKVL
jgi:hypothetical protein